VELYTIGYGGRSVDEFLALLTQNGVKEVVDVRLRPDRASMGVFVKAKDPEKGIQRVLNGAGIQYRSLPELGNLFREYPDWPARYAQFFERAGGLLLDRLVDVAQPFCLLCSEKRAGECHRTPIAEYLAKSRGYEVRHLE
jgi:uncharacterized protein (DUF488 family)